jgi:segregation and condensation protein B
MESAEIKKIIEALLFVADVPVPIPAFKSVLGEIAQGIDLEQLLKEIEEECRQKNGAVELRFIAGGWQMSTRKEFSPWIRKLYREKTTLRLSNSALETLAVIAYKQPITRSEIEEIRGVEVAGVLETILERKLVKIVGRKETIGRPLLYGTTQEFLRHFGLSHLSELPSLEELAQTAGKDQLQDEEVSPELPLDDAAGEDPTGGEETAAAAPDGNEPAPEEPSEIAVQELQDGGEEKPQGGNNEAVS